MSALILDQTTGDLQLTNNLFSFNSGIESIRQHLQVRLRMAKAEWFLNIYLGVPYYQDIFKKNPNYINVTNAFRSAILDTPGVVEILDFNYDYDAASRLYSLSFRALTDAGLLDFNMDL